MLQIFTYSTGLALTGRSAACAPATATTPAAEPRRRLFTIFIRTSKFRLSGGFRLRRVRRTLEGPLSVPYSRPVCPFSPDTSGLGDPGVPPWRRNLTLTEGAYVTTAKHRPQQLGVQFYESVLLGKHSICKVSLAQSVIFVPSDRLCYLRLQIASWFVIGSK